MGGVSCSCTSASSRAVHPAVDADMDPFPFEEMAIIHSGARSMPVEERLFWDVYTYPWVVDFLVRDFVALTDAADAMSAAVCHHAETNSDAVESIPTRTVAQLRARLHARSAKFIATMRALADLDLTAEGSFNEFRAWLGHTCVDLRTMHGNTSSKRDLELWVDLLMGIRCRLSKWALSWRSLMPATKALRHAVVCRRALLIAHIINVEVCGRTALAPWPCAYLVTENTRCTICVCMIPSTMEIVHAVLNRLKSSNDGQYIISDFRVELFQCGDMSTPLPIQARYFPESGGDEPVVGLIA